jgi:egghead protein (zeste-white 4 protein)
VRIDLASSGIRTWPWRIGILLAVAVTTLGIYRAQTAIWGELEGTNEAAWQVALGWLSIVWVLPIVPALLGLVGYMRYRQPAGSGVYVPLANTVCFRIVSRGQNADALRGTIASVRREMRRAPVFPYLIEAVTDVDVDLESGDDLVHLLVPTDYETPNRSLFKARALQYALEASALPDDAGSCTSTKSRGSLHRCWPASIPPSARKRRAVSSGSGKGRSFITATSPSDRSSPWPT